jgi:hypothetical protein
MFQRYIDALASSIPMGATGEFGKEVLDIAAILESLCGEGEEVEIQKCIVSLTVFQQLDTAETNKALTFQPVLMIADAAIASAAANTNDLDEILDAMTAGNFEFKILGPPKHLVPRLNWYDGAGNKLFSSQTVTVDITGPVRKAAKRLVRSPMLATNPEIAFVLAASATFASASAYYQGHLQIDYVVKPRPARML